MKPKSLFSPIFGWVNPMAGGVFTGKAAETSLTEIGEDLSDIVADVSVMETPWLDELGDSGIEATNITHEYLTDGLNPHVISLTANVASASAVNTAIAVADTSHIKQGMVLEDGSDGKAIHEQFLVTSVFGVNTLIVDREVADTNATSHVSGRAMEIVGSAQNSGADASRDTSSDRARESNLTQIFERLAEVSGTKNAVDNVGIGQELDHQVNQRVRELLRELELSSIRGRKLVNTAQGANLRTMAGLTGSITQTRSLGTFTSTKLDDLIQDIWVEGAQADLILLNAALKRKANQFQGTEVRANQSDRVFVRQIDVYEGFKGQQGIMQNRYMDNEKVVVLDKSMVKIVPMRGRSFFADTLGKVGDARRVQVVGEYTQELGNRKGQSMGTNATP